MLDIPELLGQIHIIIVRVVEAFDLVPQPVDLCQAVFPDLGSGGPVVNALSVLENRLQQFFCREVGERLFFPGVLRVKNGQRLAFINGFIVNAQQIRSGLSAFLFKKPIDLFPVGRGDFGGIFGNFDFGNDCAVGLLHSAELVYSAEDRVGF